MLCALDRASPAWRRHLGTQTAGFEAPLPNEAESGVLYPATNRGAFRSRDAGLSWEKLEMAWPERCQKLHVRGTTIVPETV